MYPLKINWLPETVENTSFSCITTPPLGKPDPRFPRILFNIRPRVHQKGHVGPTCAYYAARRISPHYGKCEGIGFFRFNEWMLSTFRKYISLTTAIDLLPCPGEQRAFLTAQAVAMLGFYVHFPLHAAYAMMMRQVCFPMIQTQLQVNLQNQGQTFFNKYHEFCRLFAIQSLRLMLFRMQLSPVCISPNDNPFWFIHVLKTHLYMMCFGKLGAHIFKNLDIVEFHPQLGPVYGGYLNEAPCDSGSFFSLHAVVIIGMRVVNNLTGDVYFIDPVDPSGPTTPQKVYKLSMAHFFYRLRDSLGYPYWNSLSREFFWVGHPLNFLP